MTAFYLAVKNENIELIKLLMDDDRLDINSPCISIEEYL